VAPSTPASAFGDPPLQRVCCQYAALSHPFAKQHLAIHSAAVLAGTACRGASHLATMPPNPKPPGWVTRSTEGMSSPVTGPPMQHKVNPPPPPPTSPLTPHLYKTMSLLSKEGVTHKCDNGECSPNAHMGAHRGYLKGSPSKAELLFAVLQQHFLPSASIITDRNSPVHKQKCASKPHHQVSCFPLPQLHPAKGGRGGVRSCHC